MSSLIVHKYGGTSVGTLERISRVAQNISDSVADGSKLLVVVSAMGHFTDELLAMAEGLHPDPPKRELDMLLTTGERISMALLSIALNRLGVRSISLTGSQGGILTDDTHGSARITAISGTRIRESLTRHNVVIIAGFQGVSPVTKEITTLGRGGSDLSAVALAHALQAEKCLIYTDVEGVMTAHPKYVTAARKLQQISWATAAELAWSGAQVLHHRAASLAQKYSIPVEVRSSLAPSVSGTLITGANPMALEEAKVISITQKESQIYLKLHVPGASPRLYGESLQWLRQNDEACLFCTLSNHPKGGSELALCLREDLLPKFISAVNGFAGGEVTVDVEAPVATVTLVGYNFRHHPEFVGRVLDRLPNTKLYFLDCQETTLSMGIERPNFVSVLPILHELVP